MCLTISSSMDPNTINNFYKRRKIVRLFWLLDTAMQECGSIGLDYEVGSRGRDKYQLLFDQLNEIQNSLLDPRQFNKIVTGYIEPELHPIVEV